MAADSTVNIDVILHKDQAQQSAKELDQALKDTGKDAGNKAEKNIEDNVQKASEKTKELVTNINRWVDEKGQIHIDVDKQRADESIEEFKERVKRVPKKPKVKPDVDTDSANEKIDGLQKKVTKIPKEVRTELVAQAKEQGITNFDQLLKKIPKRQLTELIAKAQKGEVINYEEVLHKLPAKLVTEVKLNDRASLPLKELQRQANETGHSFSHLKEIIAGSFVGGLAVNGIHAIGNGLRDAAKAGMEYNVEQDRMKTVWTALTTEAPKDGKTLVNFINDMAQHSIYAAGTIDRMAQSFYHVHSSVKETKDWTTAFVRLGSTLHMSNDQLAEAGEQFSKIVAGGKANAEDMSVMINRFPMFGEALQKATGKSMKQLYEMSAKGKLTAKEFTEALDYLSNKYKNSTEEAMTSFTGMSMYIKQRWSVLWGEVTQEGFKGSKKLSEDLRDILSDKMIAKYAEILGDALGTIMRGVVGILNYIGQHKDTIVDLTGNLIKIVALIGETVWQTFGDFLKIIGSMFGIVGKNGKAAVDPLELLDDVTKALVAHEGAVKALTQAFIALFAVKRIMNFIMWLSKAKEALVSFELLQRGMSMMGLSGKAEAPTATVPTSPQYLTPQSAEANAGKFMLPRLNNVSGAMNVLKANKSMPLFTAAAGVGTELMSTNNTGQKVGGSIGSVAGTALGAFAGSFMGPAGTAVGSMAGEWLGKKIGESAGNAANKAMAGHSIVAHTKVKIDADTSGSSNAVRPDLNKVARTVIKMSVDPKSIADTKQKTDKLYSDMSKSLEKYYSDKEKRSQKDLQELVKEGVLTQKQADSKLTAEKNADKRRIKEQQATISTMQRDTNNHYKRLESIENGGTKRLQQIAQKYGQNSKKYNQERIKELEKENKRYSNELVKDQMKNDRAIQASVKKGASQQEKIYKDLIKRKGTLSLQDLKQTQKDANKQYEATVKPAKKARDEVIKDANDRYKKTTDTARREWKKNGTISKKQYEEIKNNAEKQKDDTVKAAKNQYNGVTKKASDQHKKVSDEIDRQKNDVIAAANGQSTGHIGASQTEMNGVNGNYSSGFSGAGKIWNKFLDAIKSVLKFFQQDTKNVPSVPTGYAVGTGALTENQIAMVGEEGPELAHTPKGYEMLGMNGPELRYLSAGTSILTHAQTKTAMALNGGKMPGYAKGTGAKIEDFVNDVKDDAEDAFDLLGKSVSEVWDWLKQKTGLDSLLGSQKSTGGIKRTTHGTFDYAKDAISNFIKKMADKFLESLSGSVSPELVKAAAKLMHVDVSAGDVSHILNVIQHESGGKAGAVNNWDSNAKAGHPSKGILQFVQSTFDNYAMPGHHNILNPLDQLLAMFNDSTWRSDLTLGGWSPRGGRRYANGGWTDEPAIFGEIQGEPELAVNPKRDSSEEHIAEAIEARAKVNPNGFAGNLSKIINEAKQSANNMLPFISTGNNHVQATSNTQQAQPRVDGNITLTMNIDGKQLSRAVYPTLKAMRSHEVIINGVGGAVPVGNGQPLGGVY